MSYNSTRSVYHAGPRTNRRPQRGGFHNSSRSSSSKRKGQYIDPSRFIKIAKPIAEEAYAPTHTFEDFDVNTLIKTNVLTKGFTAPTPIQDQAIPLGLEGRDVIGIANTGTGKTVAFALPVLNELLKANGSRALIVAPTRELALQIEEEIRWIAKGSGLLGTVLIGGAPMGKQLRELRDTPDIVIGTPGRIKDHLERGSLDLSTVNIVVLDEVDRMLDMGFVHDVRTILNELQTPRQSFFFSATMDPRVSGLIQTFSNDPATISIKTGETSDNVHQDVVRYTIPTEKIDKLHDILISDGVTKAIVFEETQRSVERLSQKLIERGFAADAIHGGKSQGQRQRALNKFKKNEISVLVATDVAARGIDVADISHVINYSQPNSYEDYVHRIGRAGRAGKTGYALTFVSN